MNGGTRRTRQVGLLLLGYAWAAWVPLSLRAEAPSRLQPFPPVTKVSETNIVGRRVVRYEHDSAPEWGYEKPQHDYFYIVYPQAPGARYVPLRVVLHSAGGSGESEMFPNLQPDRARYLQTHVADDAYGLYLDCRSNQATDWWWGNQAIQGAPDRYRDDLCPTENRVLATVEWVSRTCPVDRNRVYLSGVSMGGSGSLGIGLAHGDVFAAISVVVPAGVEHAFARLRHPPPADPPPLVDFSAQNDGYSAGQEQLVSYCRTNRYALVFAWAPTGHTAELGGYTPAVVEYPWLAIRRDQAYPVFTDASTDEKYPGLQNLTAPDQRGQINGYFRWSMLGDTARALTMQVRLVKATELSRTGSLPTTAVVNVTFRRLQHFQVRAGQVYHWEALAEGQAVQSGTLTGRSSGLLTVPRLQVASPPVRLVIRPE